MADLIIGNKKDAGSYNLLLDADLKVLNGNTEENLIVSSIPSATTSATAVSTFQIPTVAAVHAAINSAIVYAINSASY